MMKKCLLLFCTLQIFSIYAGFLFKDKNSTVELSTSTASLTLKTPIAGFNGKLKLPDNLASRMVQATPNDVLLFQQGLVYTGSGDMAFTGTFVPGGGGSLTITTSSDLSLFNSKLSSNVTVASGQVGTLAGMPFFAGPTTLADSTSELRLGVVSKIDQNIVLNSGKVTLTQDLKFKDGASFVGSGTIDVSNRTLHLSGGTSQTGVVTYLNAADIQLTGDQTTSGGGAAVFTGSGVTSLVNGNGYTWTLTTAGKIQVGANHKLILNSVRIKGLGGIVNNGFFDIDPTGTLVLYNTKLDLAANYTHGAGTISVEGDKCKLIARDKIFTVQNANTRLRVDGQFLTYDRTAFDVPPFSFVDLTQHKQLVNGGAIVAQFGTLRQPLVISGTSHTLTKCLELNSLSPLSFFNATPGTPKAVTFDGAGLSITLPQTSGLFFHLDTNVQLTLQNVILNNFNPAAIDYGAASSTITFGDNVLLKLPKNLNIASTDRALNFTGNSTIDGKGFTLSLDGDDRITLTGVSKNLTLQNLTLEAWRPGAVSIATSSAKIIFKDAWLTLPRDGFAIKNGNIDIDGQVNLVGVDKSFWQAPTTGQLLSRVNNLGFGLFVNHASPTVYSVGISDVSLQNATFNMVRVDKAGSAFYKQSIDPSAATWTQLSGAFKSIGIGADARVWAIKTDNTVHRKATTSATLTAAPGATGDYIAVGNTSYVYMLDSASGSVFVNNDPEAVTPGGWSTISEARYARSIAADSDGSLWFINASGRVYKKFGNIITLMHEGVGLNFQKISVSGSSTRYYAALLSDTVSGGRVLISCDGSPFRDLGLFKVTDVGIGMNGSLVCTFDSTLFAENVTFGRPLYFKFNYQNIPLLCMDQAFTFSSTGNLTIKSGASLNLTANTTLNYQADPLGADLFYNSRRYLVMADSTATLSMSNAALALGSNGLALSQGNLIFDGKNSIFSSTENASSLELASNVLLQLKNNAELNLYGPIKYSTSDQMVLGTSATGLITTNYGELLPSAQLSAEWAKAEAKGYAALGGLGVGYTYPGWSDRIVYNQFSVALVSGLGTGSANRLFKANRNGPGGDAVVFVVNLNAADQSLMTSFFNLASVSPGRIIDVGTDGIAAFVHYNTNVSIYTSGIYRMNGVNDTVNSTLLGLSGVTGAVCVSIGSNSQLHAIKADGTVVKWSSGTTWNAVSLGTASGARFIATGDDGTLWFIDQYGDLKVKNSVTGNISDFPGGNGLDLRRVKAKGNINNFCLVAIDKEGNLYSAHTTRALQPEGFSKVWDCAVASSGLSCVVFIVDNAETDQIKFGGRTYIGWITDKKPGGWGYPR